jgi:hypothetical protein
MAAMKGGGNIVAAARCVLVFVVFYWQTSHRPAHTKCAAIVMRPPYMAAMFVPCLCWRFGFYNLPTFNVCCC